MATFSVRRILEMGENTLGILAIEYVASAQGLGLSSSQSVIQAYSYNKGLRLDETFSIFLNHHTSID